MSSNPGAAIIAEVVGPILAAVDAEQRPLLIALAERMAGERYRCWADSYSESGAGAGAETHASLIACAEREDEIASRVEALYPGARGMQAALRASHPDLKGINQKIFGDRPIEEQFSIQAAGERAGAGTWRALAAADDVGAKAKATFLECAVLEERSAAVLEALLGRRS